MDAGIYTDLRRAAEGDSFSQLVAKKALKVKRASSKQKSALPKPFRMLICAALSIRRTL